MGHFSAKLLYWLGSNGPLKICWATVFLKLILITKIDAYWRESRKIFYLVYISFQFWSCKSHFRSIRFCAYVGISPTVKSLWSRDCVHSEGHNELWISWKEFVLLAYCCGDTAFWRCFQVKGCGPPQNLKETWASNFELKHSSWIGLNENSLLW